MKIKNQKTGAYKYFVYPYVRKDQNRMIEDLDEFLSSRIKIALIKGDTGLGKEAAIASQIAKHRRDFDYIIHLIPTDMGKINIEKELKLIREKFSGLGLNITVLHNKESMCPLYKEVKDSKKFQEKNIDVYDLCRPEECKKKNVCDYYDNMHKIKQSKVILCDYNYVFDPYIRKYTFEDIFDKKKVLLLINEVHELPDRITSQFSFNISTFLFRLVIAELNGLNLNKRDQKKFLNHFKGLKNAVGYVQEVEKSVKSMILRRHDEFNLTVDNKIELNPERLFDDTRRTNKLIRLGQEITKWKIDNNIGTISHTKVLGKFLNQLRFTRELDYYFFYLEKNSGDKYRIGGACMNPYPLIKEPFEKAKKIILYSGTMYPDRYIRLFMLGKFGEVFVPEPYKAEYMKNRTDFFYSDGKLIKSMRDSNKLKKSAKELSEVIKNLPKPCAIFTVRPLWEKMKPYIKLRGRVAEETRDIDKRKFFSEIKKANISILSPYGSFKQSIDMSFLKSIVILGICDPMLDLVTRKTLEYYKEKFLKDKGIKADWVSYELICRLPAIEKSLQAAGRGIRKESDKLLTIWFDERWIKQSRFILNENKKNFLKLPELIKDIKKYKR